MEKRQRLFIYDRKEIGVLILLGALVAVFAFTLGIHLGKKVIPKGSVIGVGESNPAPTVHDADPSRQEISEQSKGVSQASDEAMNKALHDEVQVTGIKLTIPKAVELPKETKSHEAGATIPPPHPEPVEEHAAETPKEGPKEPPVAHSVVPAKHAVNPSHHAGGKFTLQVGSYHTVDEAKSLQDKLESFGLKPYLKVAKVANKGTWHRVFVGSFTSREEADQMGSRYQGQKMIDSFVVANQAE